MAARLALADLSLVTLLAELVVPHEADEVSRLTIDRHDAAAFAPVDLYQTHMAVWRARV